MKGQMDIHTDKHANRQMHCWKDRQAGRLVGRQTDRQADRLADNHTYVHTDKQAGTLTGTQNNRQTQADCPPYRVYFLQILLVDLRDRFVDAVHNRTHALTVWLDCRCVSSSILEMASSDASPDRPQANAQQQTVRAFLSRLFGQLCAGQGSFSQTGLLQQNWILATAARLIGDYAMWFSQLGGPEAPLEGALRLLLQAMLLSQVRLSQMRSSVTQGKHESCLLGLAAPNTHLCRHAWHV